MVDKSAGSVFMEVEPDISGFASELTRKLKPAMNDVDRQLTQIGKRSNDTFVNRLSADVDKSTASMSKMGGAMRFLGSETSMFSKVIKLIKWPALITGLNVAAGGAVALAGGLVAILGGAAPVIGLLATYPGILLSVAQAMGVFKLALGGVSTAMKLQAEGGEAYKAALKELSPVQKAFVKELIPFNKELEVLRKIAARNLLPTLGDELGQLKVLFPAVRGLVKSTAQELSRLAGAGIGMISSGNWVKDIETIGGNNVQLLHSLGKAALNVADGFRHIVIAANPLVQWLGKVGQEMTRAFSQNMKSARASGGLAEFFSATRVAAKQLGPILSNVTGILWEVLRAARPLGTELLGNFKQMTAQWLRFLESTKGQNTIAQWMDQARPVMSQMAGLIGDIVKGFMDMAQSPGVAKFISLIRTELLPTFFEIGKTASGALGPALINLGKGFLRLFAVFGTETGGLIGFVEVMGRMTNALAGFLDQHPGLAGILVTLSSVAAIAGSMGAGGIIKAGIALAQYVATSRLAATNNALLAASGNAVQTSTLRQIASWIALKVQLVIHKIATLASAAAQWLLNAAMLANPVTLVVIAIAALVAIVIIVLAKLGLLGPIWNKVKQFGIAAWNAIKRAAIAFWNWIKPVVAAVIGIVIGYFKLLGKIAVGVWRAIQAAFRVAGSFFRGVFQVVKAVVTTVFQGIKSVVIGAWKLIKAAWQGAGSFFRGIWDGVKEAAIGVWNAIAGAWNSTVGSLSFTIPGWVPKLGGTSFDMPDIPTFSAANGAVITGPAFGLVGEGRENEAILPLSKLDAMLKNAGGGMSGKMELVITNWDQGKGYMRRISQDEIDGEQRYRADIQRMRPDDDY